MLGILFESCEMSSFFRYIPYYGPVGVGLNAGVLLFNLTRMRDMVGGGFTEAIRFTWRKYKKQLRLMEQDVLNVIFEKSPK